MRKRRRRLQIIVFSHQYKWYQQVLRLVLKVVSHEHWWQLFQYTRIQNSRSLYIVCFFAGSLLLLHNQRKQYCRSGLSIYNQLRHWLPAQANRLYRVYGRLLH